MAGAASDTAAGHGGARRHNWQKAPQYWVFRRPGGAWLLCKVVRAAVGPGIQVKTAGEAEGEDYPKQLTASCPVSLATLRAFPLKVSKEPKEDDPLAYRIAGDSLSGWLRHMLPGPPVGDRTDEFDRAMREHLKKLSSDPSRPVADLLVLHDHNNGFRDIPTEESVAPFVDPELFPGSAGGRRGVILLHSDAPLAEGPLWKFLFDDHPAYRDRLVVVVNAEDLRTWGVTLVDDISLERTVADFMYNLERAGPRGPLAKLAQCRCVVVRSQLGLIVLFRHPAVGTSRVNISFLPFAITGPGSDPGRYGKMVGYSVVLVAALAKGICWALSRSVDDSAEFERRLDAGIRFGAHLGLALSEEHLRKGFIQIRPGDPLPEEKELDPYGALFKEIGPTLSATAESGVPPTPAAKGKDAGRKEWDKDFRIASVDFDPQTLGGMEAWSRVQVLPGLAGWGTVEAAAIDVVRYGLKEVVAMAAGLASSRRESAGNGTEPAPSPRPGLDQPDWALPDRLPFPFATIGKLTLVDRDEIDSFSHVERLVLKYLRDNNWKRPLSIAVFGPPGSGKSFTVKQIMKNALGSEELEPLEFNLSQFQVLDDLSDAFHQVQDRALAMKGAPLVFFDEFDTTFGGEPLGWLKYFLAPMQDGTFRGRHHIFRVPRAIFVFAGGICHTFHHFYGIQRERKEFRDAKGPDFVSRLRGHLDIPGINGEHGVSELLTVRRAILLRVFLEDICPAIIDPHTKRANIDTGVVRAFLLTRKYEHGVRSMEAIVQMATVSLSRRKFQRSSVPAAPQLAMHVDAEEFLQYLDDPNPESTWD
ncbi:MAG TPA: AAA family ATPase [Longimicrobium sp.]